MYILKPWSGALATGHLWFAVTLFAMQLSLVLWPEAVRRARRFERECRVQTYLDNLSLRYPVNQRRTGRDVW
jgi:hypothetical protein